MVRWIVRVEVVGTGGDSCGVEGQGVSEEDGGDVVVNGTSEVAIYRLSLHGAVTVSSSGSDEDGGEADGRSIWEMEGDGDGEADDCSSG